MLNRSCPSRYCALLASLILSVMLGSCSTLQTIGHLAIGQWKLFNRARPIEQVIKDPRTDPRLRQALEWTMSVKAFAVRQGLRAEHQFDYYVGLDRPAAVYVLQVCEKYSFQSRDFWFPVVGDISYLGYFDRELAEEKAKKFENDGYDVWVRGAAAYSTLGWFSDPLYSSMIPDSVDDWGDLVETIIHESVHATVYFPGDSQWNERVAQFIGERGAELYFNENGDSQGLLRLMNRRQKNKELRQKLWKAKTRLEELFAHRGLSSDQMDHEKSNIYAELERDVGRRSQSVAGGHPHRAWNNAFLMQVSMYHGGVDHLQEKWDEAGRDISVFLELMRREHETH